MRSSDLFYWIEERHSIYVRRFQEHWAKPWTEDPILQNYRFCNAYRELDTVTQWIAHNWRDPHKTDSNVWFAMAMARLVNWPETMAELGYPTEFNATSFITTMNRRKAQGKKVFSGAYIVSTNGRTMDKAEYLAKFVLGPLWADRDSIRPAKNSRLEDFHEKLMNYDGMGSFLAGQVIADTKYSPLLAESPDWWTFAAAGPGSKRGLNRVFGYPTDHPWAKNSWYEHLMILRPEITKLLAESRMPAMHAQDLQNCLCEFDKMERVRLGEGKPRSGYPGRG